MREVLPISVSGNHGTTHALARRQESTDRWGVLPIAARIPDI